MKSGNGEWKPCRNSVSAGSAVFREGLNEPSPHRTPGSMLICEPSNREVKIGSCFRRNDERKACPEVPWLFARWKWILR